MKHPNTLLATLTVFTALATPTWAATSTVTLAVPGMTCAACPITVKMPSPRSRACKRWK